MPHFDEDGNDTYLCQFCARVFSAIPKYLPVYIEGRGNKCPSCQKSGYDIRKPIEPPISLHEHCRRESGLEGQALTDYINRYYGHG